MDMRILVVDDSKGTRRGAFRVGQLPVDRLRRSGERNGWRQEIPGTQAGPGAPGSSHA